MTKFVFLLSLLVVTNLKAEIPQGLLSIERVLEEIKLPINNKILQMQQNFVETQNSSVQTFTSQEVVACQSGLTVQPGSPILRVVTESQVIPLNRVVKTYYGCNQSQSFREVQIDTPEEFRYQLLGPDNLAIFTLLKLRSSTETRSEINLTNQRVYLIQERNLGGIEEYFYFRFPFQINYNQAGFRININDTNEVSGHYLVRRYTQGLLEIFSPQGERISKAEFIKNNGFRGVNFFVDSVLQDLPETKFISSGNQNQNLINELRNAQTFLLSNTNITYGRNLIYEYIKLAEDGELQDNR